MNGIYVWESGWLDSNAKLKRSLFQIFLYALIDVNSSLENERFVTVPAEICGINGGEPCVSVSVNVYGRVTLF